MCGLHVPSSDSQDTVANTKQYTGNRYDKTRLIGCHTISSQCGKQQINYKQDKTVQCVLSFQTIRIIHCLHLRRYVLSSVSVQHPPSLPEHNLHAS